MNRALSGSPEFLIGHPQVQYVYVHDLARDGVRLTSPFLQIRVSDADKDGIYVASNTFSTVYGAGESPDEAIEDFVDNLFDQFDVLDREERTLAPALHDELRALRCHFVRES